MKQEVKIDQADFTILTLIRDTSGNAKTGLVFNSAGMDVSYTRVETDNDVTVAGALALVDLVSPSLTDPHLDWGFLEVDATKHPGIYRLDISDEVFATGAWSAVVTVIGTGLEPSHLEFVMVPELPYSKVIPPSVAQFEARTIVSAAYVVVGDTIAGVTNVGTVTGNVGGNVNGSVATVTDRTGFSLSVAGIDGIWDEVVEVGLTARQSLRVSNAFHAGECNGGGTALINYRNPADTLNRIQMVVDGDGDRATVTLNLA